MLKSINYGQGEGMGYKFKVGQSSPQWLKQRLEEYRDWAKGIAL